MKISKRIGMAVVALTSAMTMIVGGTPAAAVNEKAAPPRCWVSAPGRQGGTRVYNMSLNFVPSGSRRYDFKVYWSNRATSYSSSRLPIRKPRLKAEAYIVAGWVTWSPPRNTIRKIQCVTWRS